MRYFFCLWLTPLFGLAQFAPPAGQTGTTAMYKDSSAFVGWATLCTMNRGLQDISNAGGGYASIGDSSKALGIADNSIVSLGDGGIATCTFQFPLVDAPGPDLAVFENSFSDDYLEFAFVEVSSDGMNFFRFPATSNIQDTAQTGSFGLSDATLVNNLAGKYRGMYGTPFDLADLPATSGLNTNNVTHVRIVDAVGSINPLYATYDQGGHKVNDPWPTAFPSGGFDLDAIGVIHDITNSIEENMESAFSVFPNPSAGMGNVEVRIQERQITKNASLRISDVAGRELRRDQIVSGERDFACDVSNLAPGIYFFSIGSCVKKVIITK